MSEYWSSYSKKPSSNLPHLEDTFLPQEQSLLRTVFFIVYCQYDTAEDGEKLQVCFTWAHNMGMLQKAVMKWLLDRLVQN